MAVAVAKRHANSMPELRLSERDRKQSKLCLNGASKVHLDAIAPSGYVAFVFTDIIDSTHLWEVCESMEQTISMHNALLRELIKKHKGYEVKTEGDAFMVSFQNGCAAIEWCLDCQERLIAERWPDDIIATVRNPSSKGKHLWNGIQVRMGIHAGRAIRKQDPISHRWDYFGPVVNLAARVSRLASGGQILLTDEALSQFSSTQNKKGALGESATVRNLGEHLMKGFQHPVAVSEISSQLLIGRKFLAISEVRTPMCATQTDLAEVCPVSPEAGLPFHRNSIESEFTHRNFKHTMLPMQLCAAAGNGDIAELNSLLLGTTTLCSVNAADYDKRTALHVAVGNKRADAVALLLTAGANPNLRDFRGITALEYAMEQTGQPLVPLFESISIKLSSRKGYNDFGNDQCAASNRDSRTCRTDKDCHEGISPAYLHPPVVSVRNARYRHSAPDPVLRHSERRSSTCILM